MFLKLLTLFTLIFPIVPVSATQSDTADSPQKKVKSLLEAIRQVRDSSKAEAAVLRADALLDIGGLSRKSLRDKWNELDAEGQQSFVRLLTRIFEVRAYPKSSEFFKDLQVDFRDQKINGEKAVVHTSVSHPEEGRVDIDYKLRQTEKGWLIYEVLMDEVPMGANLRNQIRKVIKKDGYEALRKRLREKIAEFEAQRGP